MPFCGCCWICGLAYGKFEHAGVAVAWMWGVLHRSIFYWFSKNTYTYNYITFSVASDKYHFKVTNIPSAFEL